MKTTFKVTFLTLMLAAAFNTFAQTDEKSAVMVPIDDVFRAMRTGDSALLSASFSKDAVLGSIAYKDGKPVLKKDVVKEFANAVAGKHAEVFNEGIWDADIKIDGSFAQVWAPYAFYMGKKFSHCGVDAFQLIKVDGKWKIFELVDTRRREGCDVPVKVSDQFK